MPNCTPETIFNAANIINFFVALGTCLAVIVALLSRKQSSFESTFAVLLSQHNQALKDLKSSVDYKNHVNNILDGLSPLTRQNQKMHELDGFFGSYFRVLYHLLKFIDSNKPYIPYILYLPFIKDKRKIYTSLVRSNLDNETIFLLAINCAHAAPDNQYYAYKTLIERYSFLEHIIFNNNVLLKYNPSNSTSMESTMRVTKIMLTENVKTILNEIAKAYDKKAFGKNPDLHKFL